MCLWSHRSVFRTLNTRSAPSRSGISRCPSRASYFFSSCPCILSRSAWPVRQSSGDLPDNRALAVQHPFLEEALANRAFCLRVRIVLDPIFSQSVLFAIFESADVNIPILEYVLSFGLSSDKATHLHPASYRIRRNQRRKIHRSRSSFPSRVFCCLFKILRKLRLRLNFSGRDFCLTRSPDFPQLHCWFL